MKFIFSFVPCGGRVKLHGSPERLLRGLRHAVRLIQNDDLVPPFGESYLENHSIHFQNNCIQSLISNLLLGEHLDLVPDCVNTSVIGGIQF